MLVFCYLLMALLMAFGSAAMVRSFVEHNSAQRHLRLTSAFQAAEAGLDQALTEFKNNPNWNGVAYTSMGSKGGYEVAVTVLSATLRQLISTGHYPSNVTTASGYQRRQVEAIVSVAPPSPYDYALFASGAITLNSNARIDSYNSSAGSYPDTCAPSFDQPANQRPADCRQGDVGSNATAAGTITLNSNARIDGDAAIGPGGDVNTAIVQDGNSQINGSRQALLEPKTLTTETFQSGTATEPLTESRTLDQPTYRYTNVDLSSNSTVSVTRDVTIHVEGDFHLNSNTQFVTTAPDCTITLYVNGNVQLDSNSLLSAEAKPTNLKLFVTSNGSVAMNSNSKLYGKVHAPLSAMALNSNAILYGAAIANTFQVNSNAAVHYDLALGSGGSTSGGNVQLLSWRDL